MPRLLTILSAILILRTAAHAQTVTVNYDSRTIAAMTGAYGAEAASEAYYNEQVQGILRHYQNAETATAGIFSSKYLDRKALTNVGIWASAEENYYYRRIYNMVSAKIMPKLWTVSGMMLKSPHNAMYWGSYIMKTCDDTRNLCLQFESVVANSKLTFSDVAFLEFNPEVKALFDLTRMGNTDWRGVMDNFAGNISQSLTKENLTQDIDNLYAMGLDLASNGIGNTLTSIMNGASMNGIVTGKPTDIIALAEGTSRTFSSLSDNTGVTLLALVGGSDNVAGLFRLSNYSMTDWLTDYDQESIGRYYTQWYRVVSQRTGQIAYERLFDSYSMNLPSFREQINVRLASLNDNDNGEVYHIVMGEKNYYQATNEKKMKGCETVIISVTCSNDATLGEGNVQYKCDGCEGYVNTHTKTCSMRADEDDYRIPALMRDCQTAYNLTWTDEGHWDGYAYVRKATMPNVKGELTFKATLSIARKPQYLLGVKIHRAIVNVAWSLKGHHSDTGVVDVMELDNSKSDAEKAKMVNDRVSEVARQHPSCTVSTEYLRTAPQEADQSDDTHHLLWSSDRLDVAREIDARLTKIYAELISLEKFMSYKLRVLDVWNSIGPRINEYQGRHDLLAGCHERWMKAPKPHPNPPQ